MDNETVKEFLKYLNKTDTKVLSLDDLLTELKNTHETTFTGSLKTNMLTPKKGLISIDTFLDNLIRYEGQGHFLSNKEIQELENDTTKYTYDDEWYTYNDGENYLAHDINMNMFMNGDGDYLVFLQVHTGADAQWGFSSYVAIKFDTKMDYEDAFLYYSTNYELASCSLETQEGSTATLKVVTNSPFYCLAEMYAIDDDTFEVLFTTEIGYADLDNIKDEVKEYISNDKKLSKKFHDIEFDGYDGNIYIAN